MACYMFPIHKYMFVGLFSFVNFWSIFVSPSLILSLFSKTHLCERISNQIHDSDMLCGHPLEHYINGPAHHTLHHIYFTCNYGQYFTWADKYFSSFRIPAKGDDPLIAVLAQIERKKILDAVEAAEKKGLKLVNDEGEKITEKDVVTEVIQVIEEEVEEVGEVESPVMERSQSASDSGIGSEPDSEEEKEKKESNNSKVASTTTAAPPRPPRREGLRSRK